MKQLLTLTAILSGLCLTACNVDRPTLPNLNTAGLTQCVALRVPPPQLEPYRVIALPDGRRVLLLDDVRARDIATARFIVEQNGALVMCQSAATEMVDVIEQLKR